MAYYITESIMIQLDDNCTMISLDFSGIDEINLSLCTDLKYLHIAENNLKFIDLSDCFNLYILDIGFNEISELDISKCCELNIIYCHSNKIKELDISKNVKLERIFLDIDTKIIGYNKEIHDLKKIYKSVYFISL